MASDGTHSGLVTPDKDSYCTMYENTTCNPRVGYTAQSMASDGVYSGLVNPDENVYSTMDQNPPRKPGVHHILKQEVTFEKIKTAGPPSAQTAAPFGPPVKAKPSPPAYRLAAVCLGLLGTALSITIIAFIVYYIENSQNISQLKDELDHLRVNYSNLSVGKAKLQEEKENLTSVITKLRKHFPVDWYCNVSNQSTLEEDCRPCPWGWELFSTKCYYFSTDTLSWNDSRTACRKQGADLVIINNRTEQEFISSHTQGCEYWMGMTDVAVEGTWIWVDGTQLTEGYWSAGEPYSCENEDCLATTLGVNDVKNWNNIKCESSVLWICEGSSLPLSP
ncbi:CD209 antigen-like protein B isoform X1 [Lepisosteus oculatus]|uniref:CD209 antigen-like protein B isoform X1 n=1 Tax=Lepisosteus oculatus TaxID=7918 RepID=UPI00371B459A